MTVNSLLNTPNITSKSIPATGIYKEKHICHQNNLYEKTRGSGSIKKYCEKTLLQGILQIPKDKECSWNKLNHNSTHSNRTPATQNL